MTREQVRRAVGYVRVSTQEQSDTGLGLEAQREAIKAHAARYGWELDAMYEDVLSARSVNGRHGLHAALGCLKRHDADALIAAKMDRLSRSVIDFAQLLETAHKQGWAVVALDFDLDTSTPAGELVANVMAAVAQWERRIIGQRTKDALAVKRKQGVRLGRPRTIAPELAQRIRQLRRQGVSYPQIAERVGLGAKWTTCRAVSERTA